jgi:hypothetical protein
VKAAKKSGLTAVGKTMTSSSFAITAGLPYQNLSNTQPLKANYPHNQPLKTKETKNDHT